MAAIGTIASASLEAGIIEIALRLHDAESGLTPPLDNVQVTFDSDAGEATISATIPVSLTTGASGVVIAAVPYA
jgi:hypothetical protein